MSTITQRKKLSKGTWALIFIVLAALIAVIVLAAVGIVDLTFMAELVVGYATFGTYGWINAAIIIVLPFGVGMIVCWMLYRYFIGQKVTTTLQQQGYSPTPTYPTQPQQSGNETVIS